MIILVSGGSSSGKSAFAEKLCLEFKTKKLYYIATMEPYGKEAKNRIERHIKQREGKGFITIEKFTNIKDVWLPKGSTVILESLSTLLANEMFSANGRGEKADVEVLSGIKKLCKTCENTIIVTDNIFEDGVFYLPKTMEYLKALGEINYQIASMADEVIDIVASYPVYYKKR